MTLTKGKLYNTNYSGVKTHCTYTNIPIPRDCTDLCIKIGFALNELHMIKHPINLIEIELKNEMTNQKSEYDNSTYQKQFVPFHGSYQREQHSSNKSIIMEFKQFMQSGDMINCFKDNIKVQALSKPTCEIKNMIEDQKNFNSKRKVSICNFEKH